VTSRFFRRRIVSWGIFSGLILGSLGALAEDLSPKSYEYKFENLTNATGFNCMLALFISNFPAPEFVNVRLRLDKSPSLPEGGMSLSMDVGEQIWRNGVFSGVKKTPIRQINFSAPSFNSAGRMVDADPGDGGRFQLTKESDTMSQFLLAFVQGGFTVQFTRVNGTAPRGYVIEQGPPSQVTQQFNMCLQKIQ